MRIVKKSISNELNDRRYEFVIYLEPCNNAMGSPIPNEISKLATELTFSEAAKMGSVNTSIKKTRKREIVLVGIRSELRWHKDLANIEESITEDAFIKVARAIGYERPVLVVTTKREEKFVKRQIRYSLAGMKVNLLVV